jgi:hypothetical protein
MKPQLNRLLLGLAAAGAAALLAGACSQAGSLPVSPSSMAPSVDGSAAKGSLKFCAYIWAHERDPIYVIGKHAVGWRVNLTDALTWEDSPVPHGLVCFAVPETAPLVYLTIYPSDPLNPDQIIPLVTNAAGERYCDLQNAKFLVHHGQSTIWLYPDDGTHPDCHYENGPY